MVRAKKHLGQHFLHDRNIINRILDLLEEENGDQFLEIGPGPATLTRPLNQRGFAFTVIEVDPEMVAYLKAQAFDPPIVVIHGDLLQIDLEPFFGHQVKVFSNLPYNVSVPITARLIAFSNRIPLMVLMYQKEVAQRIQAGPHSKDYGPISVLVQCFFNIVSWFDLGPGAFNPPPKIQSRVLKMERRERFLIELEDIELMHQLLNLLFSQRRKMVRSVLKKKNKESWLSVYDGIGDDRARPENLEPGFYAQWIQRIKEENQ